MPSASELFTPQIIAAALIVALIAYLCGCFNGAVIVSKYILRNDVRNHGSGNAGLTNFFRTFGGALTLVVILCDMLKAIVAVWIGTVVLASLGAVPGVPLLAVAVKYWAGLFCLLGHMFPCMFHFKGGKGVLSGGALALMLDWRIALLLWGLFILLAVVTRYVSLGSLAAAAAMPFGTWVVYQSLPVTILGACIGGLIVYMHRDNVKRLLSGTERKFSLHKKA
jgi:glycerol-3-phosphate acyltransferase PlsY